MGLIKAALGAAGGTLADQWKEFFYCESLGSEILASKGKHRVGSRSSNSKGDDNIISNGSIIAVADGQCMIIVEQGRVVEVCAEPGEFVFDTSSEPSIFYGSLGKGIINTFKTIGRRFAFGGGTGKDQRVYYFNTKEIIDNKFGTPTPIPFRVVDHKIGLDIDVSVRCNGVFTYRITNPLLFYANVCGNVSGDYVKSEIYDTLKSDMLSYLAPAFSRISVLEIRPNQLGAHNVEIRDALREELSRDWSETRGLELKQISFNSVTIPKEDEDLIKQSQRAAMLQNPNYAAATLAASQADAMKAAASNQGGAMMGFMGMNAAQQAGGMNSSALFEMGQRQAPPPQQQPAADSGTWACTKCGNGGNKGRFCAECGSPKPAPAASNSWTCACGATNKGKFCAECGKPKPSATTKKCKSCGWEAQNGISPKFCPECGTAL